MTPRHLAIPILAAAFLLGCSNNTQQQRDAAQAAADGYCNCATKIAAEDPATLSARTELCKQEETAWKTAWEGLPDRANGDDDALAISNYQSGCYTILHDAWGAARTAASD